MTLEDTRASFDASGPILDFVMAHEDDPDYGDLRVLTDGKFRIQLRITDPDSELPGILEKAVGRSVEVVVGGLSRSELNTSESEIGLALNRAMTVGLLNGAKGYGVSSQTHVTLSNNVQDVFQHPTGSWVHVRNVAGGHYNGQWLIRVGQHTNEIGTIGTKTTFNHLGTSGECPTGANREGFWIDRVSGSVSQGGDSGGGGYLYYGTEWYAATLTAGHSGSQTFVSWRSIPADWSVCSQMTPC